MRAAPLPPLLGLEAGRIHKVAEHYRDMTALPVVSTEVEIGGGGVGVAGAGAGVTPKGAGDPELVAAGLPFSSAIARRRWPSNTPSFSKS